MDSRHNPFAVHEGERRPHPDIFWASLYSSFGDEASALAMYRKVAAGKTRFGDTIVELTTRYSASTQAEQLLLGTSRDEYICMKKGEIAHCLGPRLFRLRLCKNKNC